ncbi:heme ABC transporter permease CcmC [Stenotrophomonas nematodicola]|uniref:heme ABC transporter permease CcmC n=1 Tax=Stenotrophomonas nematodicola TaxID=2656746 RepID=UPI003D9A3C03
MHPIVRWFHQLGSPPTFDRFATRWSRIFYVAAVPVLLLGMWQGLFVVPAEQTQNDAFRIIYIHVPSAWMSLFVFALMAFYAVIALVWRIKICEMLAMACAPMGAGFTLITLLTGSIWGKGTWGGWWDWDPRLTSELILLFLYLGVIGLYHAIDDRRSAARAAGLLAIVGVGLLPVIRYSVDWFGGLHQRQSINVFGTNAVRPELIAPLWWMVVATKLWFVGSLLAKARADNLAREAGKAWVGERFGDTAPATSEELPR